MVKLAFIPFLFMLGGLSTVNSDAHSNYLEQLIVEENERGKYTLTGISDDFLDSPEIRIYQFEDKPIDSISDTAFVGTEFDSIVLSKNVTYVNDAAFENAPNITSIYYTGSLEEFKLLNLSFDEKHVYLYSVDEGFINFWNEQIRPEETTNICDISSNLYNKTYDLYKSLIQSDLDIVNAYADKAGAKIGDSMKELQQIFSPNESQQRKDEWNQTGAITLIIVIAVIGMTSITVFFLLKTKNIIH